MAFNFLFYIGIETFEKIICIILFSIFLFIIFKLLLKKINSKTLTCNSKFKRKEFIIYFIIIFIALFINFLANYPFYMADDIISSISQVLDSKYNDWHPFFYTFFMVKIPYMFYQSFVSCVIAQYIIIFVTLLYFCYFARKYFLNFRLTSILLVFIVLNPNFFIISAFVTKDVPFACFMMLGTMFLIEIYLSKGKWLDKKINKALFILMCICISNFRHNGIANYILMMILLFIAYKSYRKFLLSFFVIYIVISFVISNPVYKILGIEKHICSHGEMLGIPLNQFSHLYNKNKSLTEKQLRIMDNIKPLEDWKKYYSIYNFNIIKTSKGGGPFSYFYLEKNYGKILYMYIELLFKYPLSSLESYTNVTYVIWGVNSSRNDLQNEWMFFSVESDSISHKVLGSYFNLFHNPILNKLSLTVGNSLCIILFSLFIIYNRYRDDKRKYIPYILVLSNALIIMCLITGREVRFLYSSLFCLYPLILFSLSNVKRKNSKNKK